MRLGHCNILPGRFSASQVRCHPTLQQSRAYIRPYASNDERTTALDSFLHSYNHHRCHTALGGHPPISRANNASGQYI
ncbi:integrase core domain-containing protein [Streptomyces sp. NPDC051776]|uniref:integrase core domain-containing protein n=1 Tax=Streptomyces sp. NPDC051776 TaxID=3155414 RepID=UPI0034292375